MATAAEHLVVEDGNVGKTGSSPVTLFTGDMNPRVAAGMILAMAGHLMALLNASQLVSNTIIGTFLCFISDYAKSALDNRRNQATAQQGAGLATASGELTGGALGMAGGLGAGATSFKEYSALNTQLRQANPAALQINAVAQPNAAAAAAGAGGQPNVGALSDIGRKNIIDQVALEYKGYKDIFNGMSQAISPFCQGAAAFPSAYLQSAGTRADGVATWESTRADVAKTQLGQADGVKQSQQQMFDAQAGIIRQVMEAIIATSKM